MSKFKELGLSDQVIRALDELGFVEPTDIQSQAIPQLLYGDSDFIGLAQTGTGKTAAFGLPLIERLDPLNKATQALILAPTRELCQQITEQIQIYSQFLSRINVLAVYGGAAITHQIKALHKPQHVIIATPGRLIDLIKRKSVRLEQLQYLILDEADEMLNMGFKEELDKILSYTPTDKTTWLFSATMPHEIKRIVNTYMSNPIEARVNQRSEINTDIEHQYVVIKKSDKTEALTRILDSDESIRGLIFCRTKLDTQNLAEDLLKRNYMADSLHGDLSQRQRDRVMKRFKSHTLQILVATDVAARGIDVNDLTHVIHFSLPDDTSSYTHRSGRTARAGKKGISLAFASSRDISRIFRFEKSLGIKFTKIKIPGASEIAETRIDNWCQSILKQKSKTAVTPELKERALALLGQLSKDELIEKILINELNKLSTSDTKDLNDEHSHKRGGDKYRKYKRGGNYFKASSRKSRKPHRNSKSSNKKKYSR